MRASKKSPKLDCVFLNLNKLYTETISFNHAYKHPLIIIPTITHNILLRALSLIFMNLGRSKEKESDVMVCNHYYGIDNRIIS